MDTRVGYLEPGKINLGEQTLPGLAPNQVLVRTHQASVCGSERYFYRGISVRPEDEARGGTDAVLGEHGEGGYDLESRNAIPAPVSLFRKAGAGIGMYAPVRVLPCAVSCFISWISKRKTRWTPPASITS